MSARTKIAALLVGFAAVAAVIALRACREPVITVEVSRVERGRVEQIATNSRAGTVEARRRAKLSPELGGRVVRVARAGDRVTKGELVLELDAALERGEETLRARQVEAARAEADRACLAGERAQRELVRNARLAAEQLLAADLLDRLESLAREAEAACVAARAAEQAAQAALEVARLAVEKRTLRAPFDGVVAEVSIAVGEWTTPSPPALPVPPVVDLLDPDSIYVVLPMDEVDAAMLAPGLPARVTVDSQPGVRFVGRVVRVAPYVLDVEAQNRTVEIEVELDDLAGARLLPGTSADVEVILAARESALRVPAAAVLAGDRVLAVEGERLVERRVECGLRNWELVEVTAGLALGERVVTSLDRTEVRAGARVTFDTDAAPEP